eukprot:GHVU01134182.1.p1 GENE.GHVU01134182.1~~GHVU01134182.1.p1  ORF type:complete len:294 (+),score=19.36 GHVU01134182.1:181-1062(+)
MGELDPPSPTKAIIHFIALIRKDSKIYQRRSKLNSMGIPFNVGEGQDEQRAQNATGAFLSGPNPPPMPIESGRTGIAGAMSRASERIREVDVVQRPQYGADRRRQIERIMRCYTAIDLIYALEDPVLAPAQRQRRHVEQELFHVRAYGTALMQVWLRLREVSLGNLDLGDWTIRSYTVVAEAQELNEGDGRSLARMMRLLGNGFGSFEGVRGRTIWELLCRNLGQPERLARQLPRVSYREDLWRMATQTQEARERERGRQELPRSLEELQEWAWYEERVPSLVASTIDFDDVA